MIRTRITEMFGIQYPILCGAIDVALQAAAVCGCLERRRDGAC